MISVISLFIALTYGSAILAAPNAVFQQWPYETLLMDGIASDFGNLTGAAYFITNEPTGNYVVAAALSSNGEMSFNRAISTSGTGARAHNMLSATDPDALLSQGAVAVSAAANMLAAVNPGSNTLTAFSINPENPVDIQPLGYPVSSEGEFPISIAFNRDGDRLCVLNGGFINGVNCYTVDKDAGLVTTPDTLRYIGLNQTTPATGPPGSASQIIFSEDQTKLIVSIKGVPPIPGYLAVWDVAENGSLSKDFAKVSPAQGGVLPFSMTLIPGKNAILATDPGVGFEIYDFAGVSAAGKNMTAGSKSSVVPVPNQMLSCWSAHSNKTGNYYIADLAASVITEAHVEDNLKGSIVKQYPQTPLSATMDVDIASFSGNDYLYVLQPNVTSVHVLALDSPGQTRDVGTYNLAGPAKAAGLTINRSHMQGMATYVVPN